MAASRPHWVLGHGGLPAPTTQTRGEPAETTKPKQPLPGGSTFYLQTPTQILKSRPSSDPKPRLKNGQLFPSRGVTPDKVFLCGASTVHCG